MSKKPLIIIGILCLCLIATGYAAYLRMKQYQIGGTDIEQAPQGLQSGYTDIYGTAPHQSIDIDQYLNNSTDPQQSHSSVNTRGTQQGQTGLNGQKQQSAEPQKQQTAQPDRSSASTLNSQEKEEVRIAANTFMTSYDQFHMATRGMAPILNMTASTTPMKESASRLDPYITQYTSIAAEVKKQASEAPKSISRELALIASNMDQAAKALADIRSDAALGTFRPGPSMTFSNASISTVKNMLFFAEKIRELAIPVTENDPIYKLILMTGSL